MTLTERKIMLLFLIFKIARGPYDQQQHWYRWGRQDDSDYENFPVFMGA
jgi:hypothetical protein